MKAHAESFVQADPSTGADPATIAADLRMLSEIAARLAANLETRLADLARPRPAGTSGDAPVKSDPAALIGVKELTRLLVANERTVRRWRQMPGFPHPVRLSGPLRWRRNAIEEWLARRTR